MYDIFILLTYINFYILMQDAFAIQSNERGIAARDSGAFAWEIVPVIFYLCQS
jgi:hypothetical protein